MTREEFAYKVECEGWYYMLVEVDPETLDDEVLAEMLQEAQMAFSALLEVAPTVDDFSDDSEGFHEVEDEYLIDDEPEILDLVDLMDKTLGEY